MFGTRRGPRPHAAARDPGRPVRSRRAVPVTPAVGRVRPRGGTVHAREFGDAVPIHTSTEFATRQEPEAAELLAVPYGADLAPDVALPLPPEALLREYDAKGEAGEIVEVPVARGDRVGRVLLYGVGRRRAAGAAQGRGRARPPGAGARTS